MTIIFEKDFLTSSRVIMWKPSGEDRQTDREKDTQKVSQTTFPLHVMRYKKAAAHWLRYCKKSTLRR